jgi:methionyl-tRNA synthetase
MPKTFYVTTPIYYVNDVPHIGHAYTTIAADVLARFRRLTGQDVFFLTGLDEHGQKVQQAAARAGIDPQTHCDRLTPQFKNLWEKLNISNDAFIRTTDPPHQTVVQRCLQSLLDKDLIYRAEYTGWYCTYDERFWTEKDVEAGLCPDCKRPVEKLSESNYFFRMSQYQDRLQAHIHSHHNFIKPESRRNEVLGFLQKPLEDLSISRPKSRLSWGIELPFDRDYVTYVWFDALVNYISGLEYLPSDPAFDRYWPASLHLVGKDILTTHAVYWSTMLMAMDLPLPQTIFAHGWWTVKGEKMSKSRGNVVDPYALVDKFHGADGFRYFLLREVPFGQDGDFSEEAFIGRYNAELANDLGNLLNRSLAMLERYTNSLVPTPQVTTEQEIDRQLKRAAEALPGLVDKYLTNLEFNKSLETILALVQLSNQYIDKTAPWTLAKTPEETARLHTVLFNMSQIPGFLGVTLYPFLPVKAEEITNQIGLQMSFPTFRFFEDLKWGMIAPGTQIRKGDPLFPRIDIKGHARGTTAGGEDNNVQLTGGGKEMENTQASIQPELSSGLTSSTPQQDSQITIEDFQKIQLRVGKVLAAERVPKSTKLLKLQVDLGHDQRQIVAGIGKKYDPESLIGQLVVVVANLKPAKLMGVESQGMVLAAGDKEVQGLVTPSQEVTVGEKVK